MVYGILYTIFQGFCHELEQVHTRTHRTEADRGIKGMGAREAEAHTRKYSHIYYFFVKFREGSFVGINYLPTANERLFCH
jgi:hypothetical protein